MYDWVFEGGAGENGEVDCGVGIGIGARLRLNITRGFDV